MTEVDLDGIFLKSEEEPLDIENSSPVNTTDDMPEPEPEPEPVKPKRERKKRVISEEQRTKMLENLRKGREKKKRNLNKIKQDKLDKEEATQSELKSLRDEITKLKSGKSQPVKVVEPVEPVKVVEPVKAKREEPVIRLVPPPPQKPQPRIVYHGFNPNKRRY
jgi:hypothetical protein